MPPILLIILVVTGCGFLNQLGNRSGKSYVINGKRYHIMASATGYRENGYASWYGEPFHGRKTASGEVYDMNKISAAHKTLPLHTWVEVRNLDNKKVMAMRINDRGPFVKGRIIDLSRQAAKEMGFLNDGVAKVHLKAVSPEKAQRLNAAYEAQQVRQLAKLLFPMQSKQLVVRQKMSLAKQLASTLQISPAPSAGDKSTP